MVEELVKKLTNINLSSNKPVSIVMAPSAGQKGLTREGFVERDPYRLDFQGFTTDQMFANFQLQVGHQRNKYEGTAGQVLMQCSEEFATTQLIKGLQLSLDNRMVCRMIMIHKVNA